MLIVNVGPLTISEYETIIQVHFPWSYTFRFYIVAAFFSMISFRLSSEYAKVMLTYIGAMLVPIAIPRVILCVELERVVI